MDDLGPDFLTDSILWLNAVECRDVGRVGAKAANLSAYFDRHTVPLGFVVPAVPAIWDRLPDALSAQVVVAYAALGRHCGVDAPSVAVRSSALDEDSVGTSFAGQHDTYLNIRGPDNVLDAILRCLKSALSGEAMAYRTQHSLPLEDIRIAVLVQHLVPAEVSAVVFSCNPVNGSYDEVMINANWGLGESIVGGSVTPDTFIVDKDSGEVMERLLSRKLHRTVRTHSATINEAVPMDLQDIPCLTDGEIDALTMLAMSLETSSGHPVDIECAIAGGQVYLLQCRPITTL